MVAGRRGRLRSRSAQQDAGLFREARRLLEPQRSQGARPVPRSRVERLRLAARRLEDELTGESVSRAKNAGPASGSGTLHHRVLLKLGQLSLGRFSRSHPRASRARCRLRARPAGG
jgi:hypothetical protein